MIWKSNGLKEATRFGIAATIVVTSRHRSGRFTRPQVYTWHPRNYTAKDITVLEGLDPVRKRPGMYIGGVGMAGLHHLVWEILDNAVDEAMNGYASNIWVTLHADGSSITIEDDGRGIPIDKHPATKKSALEVIFTVLHAGGKFEHGSYKTAGGLHGVGASVVNALSKELVATVKRDGASWEMRFKQGKPVGALKKLGAGARHRHDRLLPSRRGDLPEDRVRPGRSSRNGSRSPAIFTRASRSRSTTRARRRSRSSSTTKGSSIT